MSEEKVNMEALAQELKRGTQVLGVLSQLKTPLYGYSLVEKLSDKGMEIDKNTLYPLLRRLEKQALLESEWNVEESRPRRYYVISEQGKAVLAELAKAWDKLDETVRRLLNEK
ncbi:MAG: PadR family transcriptional regulator [Eubacteriales bacterium]